MNSDSCEVCLVSWLCNFGQSTHTSGLKRVCVYVCMKWNHSTFILNMNIFKLCTMTAIWKKGKKTYVFLCLLMMSLWGWGSDTQVTWALQFIYWHCAQMRLRCVISIHNDSCSIAQGLITTSHQLQHHNNYHRHIEEYFHVYQWVFRGNWCTTCKQPNVRE